MAVSAAQALAYALALPVCRVSTLAALAQSDDAVSADGILPDRILGDENAPVTVRFPSASATQSKALG